MFMEKLGIFKKGQPNFYEFYFIGERTCMALKMLLPCKIEK